MPQKACKKNYSSHSKGLLTQSRNVPKPVHSFTNAKVSCTEDSFDVCFNYMSNWKQIAGVFFFLTARNTNIKGQKYPIPSVIKKKNKIELHFTFRFHTYVPPYSGPSIFFPAGYLVQTLQQPESCRGHSGCRSPTSLAIVSVAWGQVGVCLLRRCHLHQTAAPRSEPPLLKLHGRCTMSVIVHEVKLITFTALKKLQYSGNIHSCTRIFICFIYSAEHFSLSYLIC